MAASGGSQRPKGRAVTLRAWSTGCSKLRLPAETEPALSISGALGDAQGGSLVCRTEVISGIKLGDQRASQYQLHVGTNWNCSNVGVSRPPPLRFWAGQSPTHPLMSLMCAMPRAWSSPTTCFVAVTHSGPPSPPVTRWAHTRGWDLRQ